MTTGVLFATLVPIVFLILVGLGQLLVRAGRDRSRLDGVEEDVRQIKGDMWYLIRRLTGRRSPSERHHDDDNGGGST